MQFALAHMHEDDYLMTAAAPVMNPSPAKATGAVVLYEPQPWEIARRFLDILPDRKVIPLPFISQRIGWPAASQSLAIKEGIVKTARKTSGQGGCYFVTGEQAEEILIAAVFAHAAGVSVTVMLRAFRNMGIPPRDLLSVVPGWDRSASSTPTGVATQATRARARQPAPMT